MYDLDIIWNGCPMDPRQQDETILAIIFRHLQMFQYYKDLKEYDKQIQSLWNNEPVMANNKLESNTLDHDFLKEWTEKFGINKEDCSTMKEIEKWNEHDFIREFSKSSKNSEILSKESFETGDLEQKKVWFMALMVNF